jgi:predicted MPP superfamily phosphohydrolase
MDLMVKNYLTRRDFLKAGVLIAASGGLLSLGGLNYAARIEPEWVETTGIALQLPRLQPEFNGYRIVQISDIHMNSWMNRARLAGIVEKVNRLSPDLIAITGDFVSHNPHNYFEEMSSELQKLAAPDGILAVLGNHDHWSNATVIRQALKQAGVRELHNQAILIQRDKAKLHIGGIDSSYDGYDRLDLVLKQIGDQGAAILLAHEPDYADVSAASGRFDLQLSGHSHGGQVVLPWIGPPILPPHGRKYPRGLYRVGKMLQYTNRGLGMASLRVRLNCRPEITVFNLSSPIV